MIPPLPWKLIGRIAVPVLVLLVAWWSIRSYADRVADGREAEVRALWEADTAARDKVAAKGIADALAKEAAARATNEVIEREYHEKLSVAAADRESVYRLLQQARGEVRSVTSREATSATIAAATREAAIAERVDRAVAGVVTEARSNADQLDALIAVVKPQM
jgi:hypothetical protein